MRTAFLGTSEFAATVLRRLGSSDHHPVLVVTPPDRRRGRGRRLAAPPAAEAARELGIDLLQTESVNRDEPLRALRASGAEIGLVCAFGQLIGAALLDQLEMLNVHPSLLPRWRGAAPIERAIMAGDAETGVTIMRVSEGLDAGPIALQRAVPIGAEEGYGGLAARLAELGGELAVEALDRRRAGQLPQREQDDARASYAEKIAPEERRLDPRLPAEQLARTVRALNPHLGTYLELERGGRLGVRAAAIEPGGPGPGRLEAAGGELRLGCAAGALRLVEVQPPGGRPMPAQAYLRGHPVPSLAAP